MCNSDQFADPPAGDPLMGPIFGIDFSPLQNEQNVLNK